LGAFAPQQLGGQATTVGDLLKGKVVVLTGGNKGLGRAMAVVAAAEGASVVIGGRTEKDGQETIREIRELCSSPARFIRCDLTQVQECRRLIEEAVQEFGPLDGLINYAGILPAGRQQLREAPDPVQHNRDRMDGDPGGDRVAPEAGAGHAVARGAGEETRSHRTSSWAPTTFCLTPAAR